MNKDSLFFFVFFTLVAFLSLTAFCLELAFFPWFFVVVVIALLISTVTTLTLP